MTAKLRLHNVINTTRPYYTHSAILMSQPILWIWSINREHSTPKFKGHMNIFTLSPEPS